MERMPTRASSCGGANSAVSASLRCSSSSSNKNKSIPPREKHQNCRSHRRQSGHCRKERMLSTWPTTTTTTTTTTTHHQQRRRCTTFHQQPQQPQHSHFDVPQLKEHRPTAQSSTTCPRRSFLLPLLLIITTTTTLCSLPVPVAGSSKDSSTPSAAAAAAAEYTNEFAVHIKECDDEASSAAVADQLAAKYGFVNHGKIGNLDCHYLFAHHRVNKRSTEYSHEHHRVLAQDEQVHWVEQQRILRRPKRDNGKSKYRYGRSMPDPIYKDMWYLRKGALGGFDMNVESAWKMGYTGKNVVVTILDDGIQPNHPELAKNYDPLASYDINDNDPDPTPQDNGDNKHGTRCAGEVAAEAYNDYCGVGIAFNASIGGVRMLDGIVTDQVEARAIGHNPNHVDIYSASWGPEDDGKTVDGPGKLAKRAFIDGIKKGRRGKGSIYVWASGNGGRRLDNCNCDGYTNSIYTLSISSATQNGAKPWYLEECSSTLSTTYSSGTPGKDENIFTCDQDTSYFASLGRGEKPQKDSLCTKSHTGTSASAPIAAAIIALALEANPRLSWRDLQHLVMLSSRYEPLRHEKGWTTNGVGRKVSHKFGYGLLDAQAIVRHAEKWTAVPAQRICETPAHNKEREIPAKLRNQLEVSLLTNGCRGAANEIRYLEHVQAKITLKYQPRGSLKISLISPLGTITHLLFPRPRDTDEISFNAWPFLSVHFWGERPAGQWRLVVQNDGQKSAAVPGKLFSWSLIFYGTLEKPVSYLYNETLRYFPRSTSPSASSVAGAGSPGSAGSGNNECLGKDMYRAFQSEECLKACPSRGQWANTDTATCQPCATVCDSCFGPSSDHCLSCRPGGLFYEYECLARCPDGFYADGQLKECLPCAPSCASCEGAAGRCLKCAAGLVMDNGSGRGGGGDAAAASASGRCVPKANVVVVATMGNSSAYECSEGCRECRGPRRNDCLRCVAELKLLNGNCIDDNCPDGFYLRDSTCFGCHHSCRVCEGPSHINCLSCHRNATLVNGTCHFCLEGHFMNRDSRRCEACHASCSTCSGPLASDCLTCRGGLFMDNWHCVPCCLEGGTSGSSSSPTLAPEFTDCCQCLGAQGPCASSLAIDRPRSVDAAAAVGSFREQLRPALQSSFFSRDREAHPSSLSAYYSSSFSRLLNQTVTYLVLAAVMLSVALVLIGRRRRWWCSNGGGGEGGGGGAKGRRKRLPGSPYNIDYQKLLNPNGYSGASSSSSSSSSRRHNRLKKQLFDKEGKGGLEYEQYRINEEEDEDGAFVDDTEDDDEEVMLFEKT